MHKRENDLWIPEFAKLLGQRLNVYRQTLLALSDPRSSWLVLIQNFPEEHFTDIVGKAGLRTQTATPQQRAVLTCQPPLWQILCGAS